MAHTRQADILVVAAGVPGLITGEMVREGAITPVPGGIGPLTRLTWRPTELGFIPPGCIAARPLPP